MPTYEYECLKCGKVSDVFQKMSDKPIELCPQCKGKVKKLISCGCGLIFKGSGFYHTDYKKKNPCLPAGRKGEEKDKKGESAPQTDKEKPPQGACAQASTCPMAKTEKENK